LSNLLNRKIIPFLEENWILDNVNNISILINIIKNINITLKKN